MRLVQIKPVWEFFWAEEQRLLKLIFCFCHFRISSHSQEGQMYSPNLYQDFRVQQKSWTLHWSIGNHFLHLCPSSQCLLKTCHPTSKHFVSLKVKMANRIVAVTQHEVVLDQLWTLNYLIATWLHSERFGNFCK